MSIVSRRLGILAIGPVLSGIFVSCTLLNPLEHLQAGLGEADGAPVQPGNGGGGGSSSGGALDATVRDAGPEPPGCGPAKWAECGVTIVATPTKLGGADFSSDRLYFTDEAAGTIFEATCTSAACTNPTPRLTGEDAPRSIAFFTDSVLYATRTNIKRLRVVPYDQAASPEILDTASGETTVSVSTSGVLLWTDDKGARGCSTGLGSCNIVSLTNVPARSPTYSGVVYFVANGAVQQGNINLPNTTTMAGTSGATVVTRAPAFGAIFEGRYGVLASVARDAGSDIIVVDQLDEAGAPVVVTHDTEAIGDLRTAPTSNYVYWTTASGELRRQNKDVTVVTTLLRGLSADTIVVVSQSGLVAIADRGAGKLLTFASP